MGVFAVLLFLGPIALLMWAALHSRGLRRARVRDRDAWQVTPDVAIPPLYDASIVTDLLWYPDKDVLFRRRAVDALTPRDDDRRDEGSVEGG